MLTHLEERLRWQIQNSWSPFMMLWNISTDKTYSFIDAVENWQPKKKNPSYIYHCGRGLYSSRGIIQNVPNGHSLITSHTLLGYKAANDQHASRWRRHVVVPYARQIERYSYTLHDSRHLPRRIVRPRAGQPQKPGQMHANVGVHHQLTEEIRAAQCLPHNLPPTAFLILEFWISPQIPSGFRALLRLDFIFLWTGFILSFHFYFF